mmetsp:Transcript_86304/g.241367  ORF Transcript_86304/g.241367 Transcript_86304/m.241367 type:complete len:394 (+) Transcript_86304:12-1193(+)
MAQGASHAVPSISRPGICEAMGLDDSMFVSVKDISDNFKCSICNAVFDDPVFASGHPCVCTFCRPCITAWLARQSSCPNDRLPMHVSVMVPDIKMQGFINELKIFCPMRSEGCYWTGRYDARSGHEEVCPVSVVKRLTAQLALRDAALVQFEDQLDNARCEIFRLREELQKSEQARMQLLRETTVAGDIRNWLQAAPPAVQELMSPAGPVRQAEPPAATGVCSIEGSAGRSISITNKIWGDKTKRAILEGGSCGVEMARAADADGMRFFCRSVDTPEGDIDILHECVKAMNAKSDYNIGKMIFSAGDARLAVAAYVPEEKESKVSCQEWLLQTILGAQEDGEVMSLWKEQNTILVKIDCHKRGASKIIEHMMATSNSFLLRHGFLPCLALAER